MSVDASEQDRSELFFRELAGEPDCSLVARRAGTAGKARLGGATVTPSLLLEVVTPSEDKGVPWGENPVFGSWSDIGMCRLSTIFPEIRKKEKHKPEVTNRYSQSIRLITSSEVVDPVGAPAITFPEAIPGTPRIRTRFGVYYPFPSR